MSEKQVVITGIGLISSLGEGRKAHMRAFNAGPVTAKIDNERFAPYPVHPLAEIDWSTQIPKRGDLRQMDDWQRLGVHTAGLALDDAGVKGDEALCGEMDMIVAAAGGERDQEVDEAILEAARSRKDRDVLLNEKLTTELRPTLFLAQLSNLMAGNISIVHKVTGSSRTFMGEEGSGISAVEHAVARIRSGQSTHALVGGAYQTESLDFLLTFEFGRFLHQGRWKPIWDREDEPGGGLVLGSGAAFLVLEEREHADARDAAIYASIDRVVSSQTRRIPETYAGALSRLIRPLVDGQPPDLLISGASGADLPTRAEREMLENVDAKATRALSAVTGHLKEAQFPFAVALAALAVSDGACPPVFSPEAETEFDGPVSSVVATTVGYYRAEGAALVTKA